ncbi:four helix bundle protein [Nitratifractor sp.]
MGDFRELRVWGKAKDLAVNIYRITGTGHFQNDYGLRDQMRRAAVSISSNIAEGDERFSNKESIRFLYIANASCAELITQIIIAHEIGYIDKIESEKFIGECEQVSKMIKSLINFRNKNDKRK